MQNYSTGVYFSANNVVYDWTIAFLNSFRTFNPDLRLLLIPFDDECDRVLQLKDIYDFEIYSDSSFDRLEALGKAFELGYTPTGPHWFRRYSVFWGPCDHFMYLDARQVILAELELAIQAIGSYGFDLLHFDCAVDQVYQPGKLRRELLRYGKARGFNSGRWISRKGLFSLEEFEQLAAVALEMREQLNPRNTDQAFINFCCDVKDVKYGNIAEVLSGFCESSWARQPGKVYCRRNKYYIWDYGGLSHKKQLFLMHWAGYKMAHAKPNNYLYLKYRLQKESLLLKLLMLSYKVLLELIANVLYQLKSNRYINEIYHKTRDAAVETNKNRSFASIFSKQDKN